MAAMSKLTQTKRGALGQQTIARSGRIDNRSSSSEVMVSAQSTRVQGLHIKRNLTGITYIRKCTDKRSVLALKPTG